MRKIIVLPQARLDLLEIWHHIAADSIPSAHKVIGKLEAAIRLLAEMPGIGHSRKDVRGFKYLFWSVHPYVVAYHFDDVTLTIARVIHGRRDFGRLFRRG